MLNIVGRNAVVRRKTTAKTADGWDVGTWDAGESVSNVLFQPSTASDVRPDGTRVDAILHFPKTYSGDLRNVRITIDGKVWESVGDSLDYMEENTPGSWCRQLKVVRVDG